MTIPQRILFHVAVGAGLVIAVATAVTCGIVYDAARQRDLQHLATYVSERSRREEIGFQQVQAWRVKGRRSQCDYLYLRIKSHSYSYSHSPLKIYLKLNSTQARRSSARSSGF